jgi:hypothetical protein
MLVVLFTASFRFVGRPVTSRIAGRSTGLLVPGHRIRKRDVLILSRPQAAMGLLLVYVRGDDGCWLVIPAQTLGITRKVRFRLSISRRHIYAVMPNYQYAVLAIQGSRNTAPIERCVWRAVSK